MLTVPLVLGLSWSGAAWLLLLAARFERLAVLRVPTR